MYLAYKKDNLNKILFLLLIVFFMLLIFASPSFAASNEIPLTFRDTTRNITIPDCTLSNNYYYYLFVSNFDTKGVMVNLFYSTSELVVDTSNLNNIRFFSESGFYNKVGFNTGFTSIDNFFNTVQGYVDRLFNSFNEEDFLSTHVSYPSTLSISKEMWEGRVLTFANTTLNDVDGNVIFNVVPSENNPFILTSKEDLETGKFSNLEIDAGDLDYLDSKPFGLVVYDFTSSLLGNKIDISSLTPVAHFQLDSDSPYRIFEDFEASYVIPREKLGINLDNGKRYTFALVDLEDYTIFNRVTFTIVGLTAEEELKNKQDEMNKKLDDQTNAIKESNETNKNIFERIGDLLSYINPFSENFFVYKLIELLINAIKSLFIPSDDFFSTYFTDLKEWFSDRLGFLFYPFELIIDVLSKILNLNLGAPTFNIPDMYEPFTGGKFISATTFNLNSMLENNIFKTVHDIYFVCVDAFITFELVNLFKRKYEEVTTK